MKAIKPITNRTEIQRSTFGPIRCFGTTVQEPAPQESHRGASSFMIFPHSLHCFGMNRLAPRPGERRLMTENGFTRRDFAEGATTLPRHVSGRFRSVSDSVKWAALVPLRVIVIKLFRHHEVNCSRSEGRVRQRRKMNECIPRSERRERPFWRNRRFLSGKMD